LGIAEFIVQTGFFFHAQTHVTFHIIEELSPKVRMIHFPLDVYTISNNQKRIRQGETCPGQGQRADLMCLWIEKEDTLLSPGKALCQQGKGLTTEGMKGVGNGEAILAIRVIRCS
jgi:hypothetical protein